MIVKQISMDIKVSDRNISLDEIVTRLLTDAGYEVLGTCQEDISDAYNKIEYLRADIIKFGCKPDADYPQNMEKDFYTDDVIQEIIDRVKQYPDAYGDDLESAIADYWADYPWNCYQLAVSELKSVGRDTDDLSIHNVLVSAYKEYRIVRKQNSNPSFRQIVRGILEGTSNDKK